MTKIDPQARDPKEDAERIHRWEWMLDQSVPIIGNWMHRRITSALTESALSGSWLAAQSLANAFIIHPEADVRQLAGQTLTKINYTTGIDAVWGVWADTRNPGLEKICLDYHRTATHPASVRLLSALCMNALSTITHGSADLVNPLVQACADHQAHIAERARDAVLNLYNQEAIDAFCQAWQASRESGGDRSHYLSDVLQQARYVAHKPAVTRVLSALKINQLDAVLHASSDMVAPLIKACQDIDPTIAERARACLPHLQKQPAVDEFCRLWSETRDPLLEAALIQANYRARSPLPVRLLVALKNGQIEIAKAVTREGLPVLIQALQDADETIRRAAALALDHLADEETREAVCVRVIETGDMLFREIAIRNGYTPRAPELRALYFFLTQQWTEYDALDFDQSMMRAIYEASPNELRQRIAANVQSAGRTDYLTILAGVDYRSRAEQVSPSEAALMIRILAENREYARLWSLAPELALPFSLEIIHILDQNGWRPASEVDGPVYDELVKLSHQPILLTGPELTRALPMAIQRATLKVKGRVNDVAFSPNRPALAIASSQRKVVLWNFQTAAVERVIDGFRHSVGKVSFSPRGTLICAERTSTQGLCGMYIYEGQESYQLLQHTGNITVAEPVGEDHLLTAGRDQKAALWDLTRRKLIAEKEFPFWARSSAVSPDQQYAALLHDRLTLVRLPDLTIVPGYPFLAPRADGFKQGVAQNAAFAPDGKFLLAGQFNGQVALYYHTSQTQRPKRAVVTRHSQPVRGINFLQGHPIVVTAGAEGQVRFIRWPDMSLLGMVYSPEGLLTSLRVSQQGAFMATGTNEASLVLWDLRVLDIPGLFSQPLATASHEQVSNTLALSEYRSLPEPVRNGLHFLRVLLQHRFRYDIQIEEAPIIRYGEFDIILDDESHGQRP